MPRRRFALSTHRSPFEVKRDTIISSGASECMPHQGDHCSCPSCQRRSLSPLRIPARNAARSRLVLRTHLAGAEAATASQSGRTQGQGPHPSSTAAPALTMTTGGSLNDFVIIVRAGVEMARGGDPCGRPGVEWGHSPILVALSTASKNAKYLREASPSTPLYES